MRGTYALFVGLWSLSQVFSGLSRGFGSFMGSRVALGGFEAAAQPGAARIIAAIVPEKDRPLANGIMMSGGSLGAIIAPPLMILLIDSIGWRYGFTILGGLGALWTLAWLAWFRPPAGAIRANREERKLTAQDEWGAILRNPRFWACVGGGVFATPIIHISSSWIPTYLVQQWNLPLNAGLGIYLIIIYAGLDLGFLMGGAASTLLTRAGMPVGRSRQIVMTAATVCMLAAVAVPLVPNAMWAVLCVFLLNFGRASYGANYLAFNQEIAPNRVGLMAGIMGSIGAFSGALLVWAIGLISKAAGFRIPFFMLGALAVLGLAPILLVSWDNHRLAQSGADRA